MNAGEMVELLRDELIQLGYAFFDDGDFDLNLIGLRSSENRDNLFDDTFLAAYRDAGTWQCKRWPFTSDPGRTYLKEPMQPNGCAILVPGQYRGAFTQGLHTGKPALVQSKALRVWRDNDRDMSADYGGPVHEGSFAINIHRAGRDSPRIENWSAGCQVFKREADLEELLGLCDRQADRGWRRFSYTLLHVKDSPVLRPLLLPA